VIETIGWGTRSATSPLEPLTFARRETLPRDVRIEILFCGVCHTDLHQARDDWGDTTYPLVPGHEVVGRVVEVGAAVTRFAVGDLAGVSCIVGSCGSCEDCGAGRENYCTGGLVATFNGVEPHIGGPTFGGYSREIVVDEHFTLKIPDGVDLAATAPLLCAGVTTFSPLRHWGVKAGDRVGIVGIGGLGHVAVRIAAAMGAHVVAFTTTPAKAADAMRLGAHEAVVTTEPDALAAHERTLDYVLDTVAAPHELDPYVAALKTNGTMILLGLPSAPHPAVHPALLILTRRQLAGSLIGSPGEVQEMLEFCAEHGLVADIETIAIDQIGQAYERLERGDVQYRFVIDMSTLAA
jgi:alcohol dehydrogenase (NADP+)